MKVEIHTPKAAPVALSADRAAVRAELESAGISAEGVAALDYDGVGDAPPTYRDGVLERLEKRRVSGVLRADKPEGGLAHGSGKPDWLRVKAPMSEEYHALVGRVREKKLVTVCEEAACPNMGDCWGVGHLTVMILGDTCTRGCAFCNIKTGKPNKVDPDEPARVGKMGAELGLKHMVLTSVDRDDMPDGGAAHWAETIRQVKAHSPGTTVEILTPDFRRKEENVAVVARARPDVFNHNLETVPRLYRTVRPGARYFGSLRLLEQVKEIAAADGFTMFTKSGLMVGLGESRDEVLQVMDDMRSAGVDFLTLGQYLRPSAQHYPIMEYVTPEMFAYYEEQAKARGFLMVASGPLVRSSFHADRYFAELVEKRVSGAV